MDGFWFSVNPNNNYCSFWFCVRKRDVSDTRTIGVIKELEAVQKNALGFEFQTRKGDSQTVFQGAEESK